MSTKEPKEVIEDVNLDKLPPAKEPTSPTIEEQVAAEKKKASDKVKAKAKKDAIKAEIEAKKAEAEMSERIAAMAAQIATKAIKEAQAKSISEFEAFKEEMNKLKAENARLVKSNKRLEDGLLETDIEDLEKQATAILKKAVEINEAFASVSSPEEQAELISTLNAELGVEGFIESHFTFPAFDGAEAADAIPVASDLPLSEISANLPVRIIEQKLFNTLSEYTLGAMITITNVRNGLLQIYYGDFGKTDSVKAYSDITIADFNGKTTPAGTENYQVDTDVHVQYKIMDSVLNDVTVSPGLFLAIVSSSANGFVKPVALKMYERFVTFLDTVASYDEILEFPVAIKDDAKAKGKAVAKKLFSLATTSRKHLKKIPTGLPQALQYKLKTKNAHIIMNADYAADYRFDVEANTFQLGEITYPVASIIILDFDLVKDYVENSTGTLESFEVILAEKGVYQEIRHYSGTKMVQTARLFSIFHWYSRIANFRRKDKILIGWKQGTA